jgi:6-phosphofructokinase 2
MRAIHTLTMNPAVDVSTAVDRITAADKLRCTAAQRDPGGGGINASRVIARLGGVSTAVFPVGGVTGQLLRRLVAEEGIECLTSELSDETRLSFTVLEHKTDNEYRFVLPGPTLDKLEWQQCMSMLTAIPERPDLLVVSGTLPPGVPEDFYARLARLAKDWGTKFVLDTSGPALKTAVGEGLYLIKPNLRELRELTGAPLVDEESWIAACRDLIETGRAEIVALTLGHQGALLVSQGLAIRAPALPIKPVSTVGAGDSFVGAMVYALAREESIRDAFRYGVSAGSAALLTPGTELCTREDVERLYSEVQLWEV